MRRKKLLNGVCILAVAAMLTSQCGYAEAIVDGEDVVVSDDAAGEVIGDAPEETQAPVDDSLVEDMDDLVDEGTVEVIAEGDTLEQVQADEAAIEAAQQQLQEILEGASLVLPKADPELIRQYFNLLNQVDSTAGSDGELEISEVIKGILEPMGYEIADDNFHEGVLNKDGVDVPGLNILAERGANMENMGDDMIILCAHYDTPSDRAPELDENGEPISDESAGLMNQESFGGAANEEETAAGNEEDASASDGGAEAASAEEAETEPAEGETEADPTETGADMASGKAGAAVLMAAATILADVDTGVDICFVFLSGEEDGWFGSKAFVRDLGYYMDNRVKAVINVDNIGAPLENFPYQLGTVDGLANAPASKLSAAYLMEQTDMAAQALTDAVGMLKSDLAADTMTVEASQEAQAVVTPWSIVEKKLSGHKAFAEAGYPSVSIFQDLENPVQSIDDLAAGLMADAEMSVSTEESQDAEETEEAPETEAETGDAEDKGSLKEPEYESLAQVVDVICQVAGSYMQPEK